MTHALIMKSILTCPVCGQPSEETMPEEVCLRFYRCPKCETILKPRAGDCCVFCSYGNVTCPPKQAEASECSP